MMLTLPDKVCVNLVTENRDMVLLADAAERQQLLAAPDTANRVVGAAQQEQLDLIIDNFSLKISIINLIAAVSVLLQITGNQPAAIVQHHLAEWVVDRLLSHLHFQYASGVEHLLDPATNTLRTPMWYATMCDADGTLLEQCNIVRAFHRLPLWKALP